MADGSSPVKRKSLLARGVHRIGKRVLRRGSTTRLDNDLVSRSSPTPASPLPSSPAYATESPTSRQLAARQHLREHFKSEAKAKNVFCHTFATSRSLGFTICVARFGADGRYFVQVDATMVGMPARSKYARAFGASAPERDFQGIFLLVVEDSRCADAHFQEGLWWLKRVRFEGGTGRFRPRAPGRATSLPR